MATYRLTIYWWIDHLRNSGGEYEFAATDDAGAMAYAQANLEEPVALADQSEITDLSGRVVWANEWPIPPTGRLHPQLAVPNPDHLSKA